MNLLGQPRKEIHGYGVVGYNVCAKCTVDRLLKKERTLSNLDRNSQIYLLIDIFKLRITVFLL